MLHLPFRICLFHFQPRRKVYFRWLRRARQLRVPLWRSLVLRTILCEFVNRSRTLTLTELYHRYEMYAGERATPAFSDGETSPTYPPDALGRPELARGVEVIEMANGEAIW